MGLRQLVSELAIVLRPASPRRSYANSQEFYAHVDEVTASMRALGSGAEAARIHELLHERAWTTGNELTGELRRCFASILSGSKNLPAQAAADLRRLVREIDRAERSLR